MDINDLLAKARRELAAVSGTPALDAEWLLLEVLGRDDTGFLIAHGEEKVSPAQEERYLKLVERRAKGEPLAYILGWWEFYGRRFKITPAVLVPRPETEDLIDRAMEKIKVMNNYIGHPLAIADIGTGSGCIAVTLQLELENFQFSSLRQGFGRQAIFNFQILATDVSVEALQIAKGNARKHGVEGKIEWREGDMLEAVKNDRIDLIVSNPPYVPTKELVAAKRFPTPETAGLNFEPRQALDGGADGNDNVKQIVASGIPYVIETRGGEIISS